MKPPVKKAGTARTLLELAARDLDETLRGLPLADGEIDALEYYGTNQHPDPLARSLIMRACAELRARRAKDGTF